MVSRRPRERRSRPDGVRPPLRAHDVPGLEARAARHILPDVEGAGGSNINGTTDFDRTNYFETLPSNQLELALWLESDRMGYLLDMVDQASLSNQQDVVRNERRQSVENQPYGIVDEAMFHTLFPKTHPYYADVIGSHADIQAAKLDDVKNFFKLYYAPNNASLAIVGDIDKAATKALVEKYFGPFKKGGAVPKPSVETPKITAERRVVVKDRVELPRVYMAWITSPFYQPGDADADIAATVLGGGKSSRLYKTLVYDKQIAQTVSAQQYSLMLGIGLHHRGDGAARAYGRGAREGDRRGARRSCATAGPEANEVERARNVIETRIVQGLENLGGFGGVADRLNMYNHYLGDPGYLPKDIQRYRAVTPASVKAFAQEQLAPTARVVVYGVPGQPDLGAPVATPPKQASCGRRGRRVDQRRRSVAKRSAEGRPRPDALQVPVPASFQLPNGLTVLVNERPGLPIVSAHLVVKTGSGANPGRQAGAREFHGGDARRRRRHALGAADRGRGRAARRIADDLVDDGRVAGRRRARCSGHSRRCSTCWRTSCGVRHFPQEEIERQRASRLASLVQQRENSERGGERGDVCGALRAGASRTATPSSAPRRRTKR